MPMHYLSPGLLCSIIVLVRPPTGIDAFSRSIGAQSHSRHRNPTCLRLRDRQNLSTNTKLRERNEDFQDDSTTFGGDENRLVPNDLGLEIVRGTGLENSGELSDETWEELETGGPSRWVVLKNVRFVVRLC